MTHITEKLKNDLSGLSVVERAELAHFLIDSLEEEEFLFDDNDDDALDEELTARLEDIATGREPGIPAENLFAGLREIYS